MAAMSLAPPGTKSLSIGAVPVGLPFVQAALSGYSDWPMRVIARRLGAPYTLCEVMLDKFVVDVTRGSKARRYLKVTDEEHPVGGQLMGAEPERFGPAAKILVDAGFDVIDINFGCPVKKVLGRCRGGFHLSQPDVALEIVAAVRSAVPEPIPVTVKMRRGIDDSQESRAKFFQILDGAFERGVAAVTVHGRTVMQRYVGPSRWDFLREVKQHLGERTILGSGDLFSPQNCLDMLDETGVDGCTVARGAIGNPWIFSQCAALARGEPLPDPPSLFEQREVIHEHYALADETYGAKRCCPMMRKFGIKYSRLHPQAVEVRDAFVKVRQPGQWQEVLDRWYGEDLPGVHPPAEPEIAGTPGGVACESSNS
ncbi:MAG: tRNA-dihydrouridine synthase family protein [Planctomycetota bacterium]|nr:MAG: tRNA-dihydrouridine synthase family protein [Planctomycetota bacterium]REK43237.1 MAG: tRNA-dihydrouridine synthase family protein [Planctomycetota bacterium]